MEKFGKLISNISGYFLPAAVVWNKSEIGNKSIAKVIAKA